MILRSAFLSWGLVLAVPVFTFAADAELTKNLAKVRAVGVKGEGHREAGAAAKALAKASPADLPVILAAMDGSNVLAENWLRGIAEGVAQKQTGKIPVQPCSTQIGNFIKVMFRKEKKRPPATISGEH